MKPLKLFLSILDGVVVTGLSLFSFELSLYLANKLYQSDYIQNIHKTTDLTQLSGLDIFIGTDGGMITLIVGTLAFGTMVLKLYRFILSKMGCNRKNKNRVDI